MSTQQLTGWIEVSESDLDSYIPQRFNARRITNFRVNPAARLGESTVTVDRHLCTGNVHSSCPVSAFLDMFMQATAAYAGALYDLRWNGAPRHARITPKALAFPGDELTLTIEFVTKMFDNSAVTGRGTITRRNGEEEILIAECDGVILQMIGETARDFDVAQS